MREVKLTVMGYFDFYYSISMKFYNKGASGFG